MLAKGKSLKTTSELLGHSTISITGDIYAHLIDEVKRDANDTIDEAIFGDDTGKEKISR